MADSVNKIYNDIVAEKAKYSSLDTLDSTSETALWKSIFQSVASEISVQQQLMDLYQSGLVSESSNLPTGTIKWYATKLLEYQEGYNLIFDKISNKVIYSTIDDSAKILKVATAEEEGQVIVLKTAKSDGGDGLAPLTAEELISVNKYINDFKFAGPTITLISTTPDVLALGMNVKVNKMLINNLGQSVSNTSLYPVEDIINSYLKSFQNELYNSEFKLISLIDAIQSVPGVLNVKITTANAHPNSSPTIVNILETDLETYKSNSGWFTIDPAYTLRNHIIYL